MVAVPSTEDQALLTSKLKDLIKAIESEPGFTPPTPHAGLLHVWDFVQRSHYMMLNLENIRTGAPIEHPQAIPKNDNAKDNAEKAQITFTDVITRSMTIDKLINSPAMLSMMGGSPATFSQDTKDKSQAVLDTIMELPDN
ncbi:uncharacterized protein J7T54_002676 [Emericellopsis cladophorae]|uniref:Uncharacterized protein n=1 Tax=Emericellopsis cladophorae TaxID=2686198 RepID=A0A9P9XW85_9HYPO|nr:uncharacterized protein J7T54_002676 [Emericellopsis cladophorae]KAI6778846.1 hypothetical protein J7T54_002676 [Emericellopsis cladophorae]